MNEPRHGMIVSGEVIPPQTYLHKVAAAKRDEADDDAQENTADAPEDTAPDHAGRTGDITDDTDADETHDAYAADDEDDGLPADTVAMPAASANRSAVDDTSAGTAEPHTAEPHTAEPGTAEPHTAGAGAAWTDTADTDPTRNRDQRDGILETDAARATAAQQYAGTDAGVMESARPDAGVHAGEAAAIDATQPDIVAPEAPAAAKPEEGRPGDVPIPEDVSLIEDGAVIREQWMRVQASFVDNPRAAVSAAAGVITDAAARVETAVRARQQVLRDRWDSEGRTDTEELRVTMQQYRQLLERLAAL